MSGKQSETVGSAEKPRDEARTFDSASLFGAEREIVILHRGARYVLRMTRQGKLLLNK